MKNKISIICIGILLVPFVIAEQTAPFRDHHWKGKRVAYIGDSITDPNGGIRKFWSYLEEWLDIIPYVYGISGRQWTDAVHQGEQLKKEHGNEVDAIIVFLGTNDFNHGVPIGEWFTEKEEQVLAARGEPKQWVTRKKRTFIISDDTFKGRINKGISKLKEWYPTKQIVLLTPLHRSFADFGERNVQPDENYQNSCGEYIDAYVAAIKEAGNIWGVPVIDINALTGLNPMVEEQVVYFQHPETDRLHPNDTGQKRLAYTLVYQLLSLSVVFDE